jgi:hypothetical protein
MIIDSDIGFKDNVNILTTNKVDTIGRYYCDDLTSYKVIGADEARQLRTANIRMFAIFESATKPADLSKGQYHAGKALDCAKAVGQPSNSTIYFGIEQDGGFTQDDMPQVTQYFKDINATIAGKFDIGVYSNGTTCATLIKPPKLVKYTWLAAASYTHDGTTAFFKTGLWTMLQMGPTDIPASLLPNWKTPGAIKWTIDLDFANGDIGSFIPNPPPSAPATV